MSIASFRSSWSMGRNSSDQTRARWRKSSSWSIIKTTTSSSTNYKILSFIFIFISMNSSIIMAAFAIWERSVKKTSSARSARIIMALVSTENSSRITTRWIRCVWIKSYCTCRSVLFQIDFALRNMRSANDSSTSHDTDGPCDQAELTASLVDDMALHHTCICGCSDPDQCMVLFRRCVIKKRMFHSLMYFRRNSAVSYFVLYRRYKSDLSFGKIRVFFTFNREAFAFIEHHRMRNKFSEFLALSPYHEVLSKPIDCFYFVLHQKSSSLHCVCINSIENHCIVNEVNDCLIVTPLSSYNEHDWTYVSRLIW